MLFDVSNIADDDLFYTKLSLFLIGKPHGLLLSLSFIKLILLGSFFLQDLKTISFVLQLLLWLLHLFSEFFNLIGSNIPIVFLWGFQKVFGLFDNMGSIHLSLLFFFECQVDVDTQEVLSWVCRLFTGFVLKNDDLLILVEGELQQFLVIWV